MSHFIRNSNNKIIYLFCIQMQFFYLFISMCMVFVNIALDFIFFPDLFWNNRLQQIKKNISGRQIGECCKITGRRMFYLCEIFFFASALVVDLK